MEYVNHRKHSAGARNVKARAKRALLLPSVSRERESQSPFMRHRFRQLNVNDTGFET